MRSEESHAGYTNYTEDGIAARTHRERGGTVPPDSCHHVAGTNDVSPAEAGSDSDGCNSGLQAIARVKSLRQELADLRQLLESVSARIEDHRAQDAVLADVADRHRALAERFHEREVLQVMLLALIGVADRVREAQERLGSEIKKCAALGHFDAVSQLTRLLKEKDLDLVDIENALAHFGVEPYEHPDERFDPSVQQSRCPVTTPHPALDGLIAARLFPGYRRGKWVVRPERVRAYVRCAKAPDSQKGA